MKPEARMPGNLDRRTFLGGAGITALAACTTKNMLGGAGQLERRLIAHTVATVASGHSMLRTYRLTRGELHLVAERALASERAAAIAAHPSLPTIYLASDRVKGQVLPHGVIESYELVNGATRESELRPLGSVAMSLSATRPRSLAVTPDGSALMVTAFGGGAWNSFALDERGTPAVFCAARKETGHGPVASAQDASHPFAVLATHDGMLTTDLGCDRLSLLRPGVDGISVTGRAQIGAGAGPAHALLLGGSRLALVSHALREELAVYAVADLRRGDDTGQITPLSVAPMDGPVQSMAAGPSARVAYIAVQNAKEPSRGRLETWHVDAMGELRMHAQRTVEGGPLTSMGVADGWLWAASPRGLLRFALGREERPMGEAETVLRSDGLHALVFQALA